MYRLFALILASSLLTGCIDTQLPTFIDPPKIEANSNQNAPLTGILTFEADEPVSTRITISDGRESFQLDFDVEADATEGLPIVGLRPGVDYTLTVAIQDRSGNLATFSEGLPFHTPDVSDNRMYFPPISVVKAETDRMEPGVTLLSVRRRLTDRDATPKERREFGESFGMLLALDNRGRVVWCYLSEARISDFERRWNGNFVYITYDQRIVEIDLMGNVQNEWYAANHPGSEGSPSGNPDAIPVEAETFHHEVDITSRGRLVAFGTEVREIDDFYTSETDPEAPRERQRVVGDEIIEFDPATGETIWKWNTFDHLDPMRIGFNTFSNYWPQRGLPDARDWTHGNGFDYDIDSESYLVSLRFMDALFKVKRATGEIQWILGKDDNWPEHLQPLVLKPVGDVDWPWHQHAPTFTEDGTVMLFNNRNYMARPFQEDAPADQKYSSAVEYEVDESAMTVRQVWTSETMGDDNVISAAMGDADVLPTTGNVLVSYGAARWRNETAAPRAPDGWSRLREFTRTTPAELLFEVQFSEPDAEALSNVDWIIYGGMRVPQLLFEPER